MTAPARRYGAAVRALIRGRSRSTTPRILLALIIALMAATLLVLVTGLMVAERGRNAADAVRTRAVPAVSGIVAARTALVRADAAAVESLRTGARLVGPGEHFYNQIAIAVQGLTRAAGANLADEPGNRKLRLAAGLLTSYTRLVQQAATHPDGEAGELLRARDLYSASQLLHDPDGGALAHLDGLLADYDRALHGRVEAGARHPGAVLPWALATAVAAALLVAALVFFARRFRRLVNAGLAAALALLLCQSWVVLGVVSAHDHLRRASDALSGLVHQDRSAAGAKDREALRDLVLRACGHDDPARCGETVARFATRVAGRPAARGADDDGRIRQGEEAGNQAAADTAAEAAAMAGDAAGRQPLLAALAALAAVAVYLGFRPRLNEYRYRST